MRIDVIPSLALDRNEARLHAMRGDLPGKEREQARLKEVAKEFEALLLESMMREMRKNVPESPIFGRDTSREIFNEMLDGEYVRLLVQQGGLGIADLLVRQLESRI